MQLRRDFAARRMHRAPPAWAAYQKPTIRLTASIIVFALALAYGDGAAWAAKHRKVSAHVDSCTSMLAERERIAGKMKAIDKAVASEQSAPRTLVGVFQRMQGHAYLDQSKVDEVARLRREAEVLNHAMLVAGCAPAANVNAKHKASTAAHR